MSPASTELTGRCPGCNQAADPGMAFCMFCGFSLRTGEMPQVRGVTATGPIPMPLDTAETALPGMDGGRVCPICGKFDPLSTRFCIYCGQETQAVTREQYGQMISHTAEMPAPGVKTGPYGLTPKLVVPTIAGGLLLGLMAGFFGVKQGFEEVVVRNSWPAAGLVIYGSPPGSQVTIEELSGRNFTLGQLGVKGDLSIPDLAPGNYRVTISSPGYGNAVEKVQVERNKPAVLGFPRRIELLPRG